MLAWMLASSGERQPPRSLQGSWTFVGSMMGFTILWSGVHDLESLEKCEPMEDERLEKDGA